MGRFVSYILDIVILSGLLFLVYQIINPEYVWMETHVAGGDMISHPWISKSIKEFWENGLFWGWNHGWFGGFPFLYYYFYPIYWAVVFLEYVGFSELVAFKLMVFGVVSFVPVTYYISARQSMSFPFALLFAALGMSLFFNEFDSRWGGNMKSLLAGQVSHMFGILCLVWYTTFLFRNKPNSLGALFFLSLAILSHVYSAFFAGLVFICYFLSQKGLSKNIQKMWHLSSGFICACAITAFWWLPFLYYRNGTLVPISNWNASWTEVVRVLQLTNPLYVSLYSLTGVLLLFSLLKNRKWSFELNLISLALLCVCSMPYLEGTPLSHTRLTPQVYLIFALVFISLTHQLMNRGVVRRVFVLIFAILCLQRFIPSEQLDKVLPKQARDPIQAVSFWWKWNISGIESIPKTEVVFDVWKALEKINDPEGRVAVEYFDYDKYGSPRIFEMTPYVSGKPVIEGLLLESSGTYPLLYYINFLYNPQTWWPGFNIKLPNSLDPIRGVRYWERLNVKYLVLHQEKSIQEMDRARQEIVYRNEAFTIYKVNHRSRIASVIWGGVPEYYSKDPLRETILQLPKSLENFVVMKKGDSEGRPFPIKRDQVLQPLEGHWSEDGQSYVVENTLASKGNRRNIILKIPYFPNWKVTTGEKIQLVTPNIMFVQTEQPRLTIEYKVGWAEKIATMISVFGFVLFFILWRQRTRKIVFEKTFA